MIRKPLCIAVLLLIHSASVFSAPQKGFVNLEKGVKLSAPGSGWDILSKEELAARAPGAAAGAVNAKMNLMGLVIIEELSEVAKLGERNLGKDEVLLHYAIKASEQLRLENIQISDFAPVRWKSRDAMRFNVVGSSDGVLYRYGYTVLIEDSRAVQLVAYGFAAMTEADGSSFFPFFNAVEIVPVEKKPRVIDAASVPVPVINRDRNGVGWRVRDGGFASSVYHFSVTPPKSWRIFAGSELATINPAAEVVFQSEATGVRVVIIPETAKGVDEDRFLSRLRAGFSEGLRAGLDASFHTATIAGRRVTLYRYYRVRRPADPSSMADQEYYYGSFIHKDVVYQFIVPYQAKQRVLAAKEADSVLAEFKFLVKEKVKALAEENQKSAVGQNHVNPDASFRNGLYRNFTANVTWRKPYGAWRVRIGEAAQAVEPDGALFFEEPSLGIYGLLSVVPAYGSNNDLHFTLSQEAMLGAGFETQTIRENVLNLGSAEARFFWANGRSGEVGLRYLVGTAVWEDHLIEIRIWGLPGNVAAAEAEIREAVNGFRFHDRFPAVILENGVYTDQRFGFRFEAPRRGWKFEDLTDERRKDYASFVSCYRDDQEVLLIAYTPPAGDLTDTEFARFVRHAASEEAGLLVSEFAPPGPAMLSGMPAFRFDAGDSTVEVVLFAARRDATWYGVLVFGKRGKKEDFESAGRLSVHEFRGRFELIR